MMLKSQKSNFIGLNWFNPYHRLIDLNKEGLDKLDKEGLEDRTDSNDYTFEGVNLDETGLDEEGYGSEVDDNGLSEEANF